MKRDLSGLSSREYDLLVIGGGIYGACIAWDAALRGLSVALVEKGDFGWATSANSLKIIHGGMRYLRDLNFRLMRTMVRERSIWMRIAPHLVRPLPFLMPTSGHSTRGRLPLLLALAINDIVGYDRNLNADPLKQLPNGRIVSKEECLEALPGLRSNGVTGGAVWYDAQISNSERLLLSIIKSATESGAIVANYTEAIGFLQDDRHIRGIRVRDVISGAEFEIRARMTVNCAGAWVDDILSLVGDQPPAPTFHPSIAMNLVTRQMLPDLAIGVSSNRITNDGPNGRTRRSKMLFIVPWSRYSLIGTAHFYHSGPPQTFRMNEEIVQDFIDEVNDAYPGAALLREDVYHVHYGFLAGAETGTWGDEVKLVRKGRVHDHAQEDGIDGLITVVGVKYTAARHVAQETVDLVAAKLGLKTRPCSTHRTPVSGGEIDRFDEFLASAVARRPEGLQPELIEHLVFTYGSKYNQVLRYLDEDPALGQTVCVGFPVIRAEVIHAIRQETAQTLTDVIQRRTELGAVGLPDEACISACADLMTAELGWDRVRRHNEIEGVYGAYDQTTAGAPEG